MNEKKETSLENMFEAHFTLPDRKCELLKEYIDIVDSKVELIMQTLLKTIDEVVTLNERIEELESK